MTADVALPRVDFYVLESADERARLLYACRYIEKAFAQKHTVYVHVDNVADAKVLDDLLWTFNEKSFIPHSRVGADAAPVQIGHEQTHPAQVLVQLAAEPLAGFNQYERVAEFVDAAPTRREQGRTRFAWYRDQGVRPETHKVATESRY